MAKFLITGAGGMLGQAVTREFQGRNHTVTALSHAWLDITDLAAVKQALVEYTPEVIINCAAYTKVDQAETDYEAAVQVNALGVRNLALACKETGAVLVHISTDYVFDGQKNEPWNIYDTRHPINAYGRSKYLGERFLETIAPRYYLVRTSWLFGPGGPNFVETILKLAREKETLTVVDDQWGCPTYTIDLARALAGLVASGCYGVYHITNQGATTWYRFAREILAAAGVKTNIKPVTTAAFPRPARRPAYSVLDPFPLKETIGYLLPPWQDALMRYFAERRNTDW
ncbi:dTDP-4-dehydrorhamnose reductase [Neomoorella humiferrea]|uniref:dTDP-4-dehydrorhamnose reductase n=1 Tax=Neomoorella humiferrea TaxID=676965 RepID=A0A2T0ANR9_9FIRM|nr:dTDP-4-dehydrorhamnose reductase [Moorella humiferrea]PRR70669.1 dTDP-4-dehydrorhamnose reductase [Moorella humiferrea]